MDLFKDISWVFAKYYDLDGNTKSLYITDELAFTNTGDT